MRVATRRIRAALSTFREHLSPTATAAAGEIAWLTRLLGPVRDLDVQIERLDTRMAEPGVDAEALAGYREVLARRRTGARKRLLVGLDSRRYERAVRRWTALLTRGPARTFAPGRVLAIEAVPPLVERRYRRLRKRAGGIRPGSEASAYHIARIEAKKLRYAAEFGAPLYGERATAFVESVKALQDVLGAHQDATVAMETLAAEAGNRRLSSRTVLAMGALAEHYRTEAERLRSAFPASYRAVKGVRWKRFRRQMARRAARSPGKAPVVAPRRTRAGRRGGDTAQIDKARPTG
jgi:CHAD domain-containing protein